MSFRLIVPLVFISILGCKSADLQEEASAFEEKHLPTVRIFSVTNELPLGTQIEKKHLVDMKIVKEELPDNAVGDSSALIGKFAKCHHKGRKVFLFRQFRLITVRSRANRGAEAPAAALDLLEPGVPLLTVGAPVVVQALLPLRRCLHLESCSQQPHTQAL